jgi:hypothetical protein
VSRATPTVDEVSETPEPETPATGHVPRPRRRRQVIAAIVVLALIAAGVAVAVTKPFGGRPASSTSQLDNGARTTTSMVQQRSLTSQVNVNATLGYAGSYTVVDQLPGTITALPAVGRVVQQGDVLFRVDGSPVVLLYGSVPAYRSLSEGMTGADVRQLNAALVSLRYATRAELDPTSTTFKFATLVALEKLQVALGVTKTGTLALGQAVFLPTAARITGQTVTPGSPAQPGMAALSASSTARQVVIQLDAAQQSQVKVGDQVLITLPDNSTTPGVVSFVGTVATSSSSSSDQNGPGGGSSTPTVEVHVRPLHPAHTGRLDQAPVTVAITTGSVQDALVVPVNALLALAVGGYAVEVVSPTGTHSLVPVELGLFDDADGLVQVTSSGLAAGQRVVVPAL